MSSSRLSFAVRHLIAAAWLGLSAAGASGAAAQKKIAPVESVWTVSQDFAHDDKARTNLSGAACATDKLPFASCLIVNDDKKYAQFFSIDGARLVPGAIIRLVDKSAEADPDAEGAAYDNSYFYVIGSHGRPRFNTGQNSDPRYRVFRFPVDKTTGKPAFKVSEDDVVGVESSSRLRAAIKRGKTIGKFYDKPLDENGVNIEGIAVKDGRMYLGLRAPSVDQHAFIVSADAGAVFSKSKKLNAKVHRLKLGEQTGIRDLAAVRGGLLVLTGPVNDQAVAPAVYLWNEKSGALTSLGELQLPALPGVAKPETLLVLRDAKRRPWRVLVIFDGPANGAPTEYEIAR